MPSLPVLVLNSGSSSIKFSIYEAGDSEPHKLHEGAVEGIGTDQGKFWIADANGHKTVDATNQIADANAAFRLIADSLQSSEFPSPAAIGHRMVNGGPNVQHNQLITPSLIDEMERYKDFAPLHTPAAIFLMRESLRIFHDVPNFVCLDSYFHRTMPEVAMHLPIPEEYSAMGIRRYGAHGISCESILLQLQPNIPEKLIVAHLGNGASVTAIGKGKSIDTSMGLTPTGGIISATRTGDIDPGVLLYILRKIAEKTASASEAAAQLEVIVDNRSGLLGVSNLSSDMRDLRAAIGAGNKSARLAVDKFTWTIAKAIGSYIAELNGLDMLVFTGGIGVNDIATRAEVCANLGALGILIDPARNNIRGAAIVSTEASPVVVRVLPPAEDLIIANHVVRLLAGHMD